MKRLWEIIRLVLTDGREPKLQEVRVRCRF
jgi:hypothetical protein